MKSTLKKRAYVALMMQKWSALTVEPLHVGVAVDDHSMGYMPVYETSGRAARRLSGVPVRCSRTKNQTKEREKNQMSKQVKTVKSVNRLAGVDGSAVMPRSVSVQIQRPKFQVATFPIVGTSPLVICRFSVKAKGGIAEEHAKPGGRGRSTRGKKMIDHAAAYEECRYRNVKGWEGFHASAPRNGMISACRLVGFKMTIAKLSVFIVPDGYDQVEPQIPLIRLYDCKPEMQQDAVRNTNTGQFSVTTRAAYHNWKADLKIKWDTDQFALQDVANLLQRVGTQIGFGCGRYDSPESAGMGWGLFEVEQTIIE